MTDTLIQVESPGGEWFTVAGLGKGDRGVFLGKRVEGLWMAPKETIYNSTAFEDGATYGGDRNPKREVVFEVEIIKTLDSPWEKNWSDWAKAWKTDEDTKLWYETDTSRRFLKVRLAKQADMAPSIDPMRRGHVTMTMTLVAGDPWWYEDTITSEFITHNDTTASGFEDGHVDLWHETPLPLWPVWEFQGTAGIIWTIPDFSWGQEAEFRRTTGVDAARKMIMPPTIAGEHVLIDVDPLAEEGQANSSLDTQYYMRMGGLRFVYPIPPYTGSEDKKIQLPIRVSHAPIGAGIQLRMRRAWPTPMGMQA